VTAAARRKGRRAAPLFFVHAAKTPFPGPAPTGLHMRLDSIGRNAV